MIKHKHLVPQIVFCEENHFFVLQNEAFFFLRPVELSQAMSQCPNVPLPVEKQGPR